MSYNFDILGVATPLSFFNYQQTQIHAGDRSKTYLGSYHCTLDGFLQSVQQVPDPPDWDWDAVVESIVQFWLHQADAVAHWRQEFQRMPASPILVARVAHVERVRQDLESLFQP